MGFSPTGENTLEIAIEATDNASDDIGGVSSALGRDDNSGLRGAAAGAGLAIAGVSAALAGKAVQAAADFESAMGTVNSQLDDDAAAIVEEDIENLATSMAISHDEAATLAGQIAEMGFDETEIGDMLDASAEFAAVSSDINDMQAAEMFEDIQTALEGFDADNVDELADGLWEVASASGASEDAIANFVARVGPMMEDAGFTEAEILGIAGVMEDVLPRGAREAEGAMGAMFEALSDDESLEQMATALGMSTSELQTLAEEDPSALMLEVSRAMDEGGESANILASAMGDDAAESLRIVGQNAEDVEESIDGAGEAMEEGGDVSEEAAERQEEFHNQMAIFRDEVNQVAIDVGTVLLPALMDLIDIVRPAIQLFLDFNEATDGVAGVAVLAAGVIGGLAVTVGALIGPITTAISVAGTLAGAVAALNPPVLAVIAVVGAAIAIWTLFGDEITEIAQYVLDVVTDAFGNMAAFIDDTINNIVDFFTQEWGDLSDWFFGLLSDVFDFYVDTWTDIFSFFRGLMENVFDFYVDTWTDIFEFFSGLLSDTDTEFSDVWSGIQSFFEDLLTGIFNFYVDTWTDIFEFFSALLSDTDTEFSDVWSDIQSFIERITTDIFDFYVDTWTEIFNFFTGTLGDIESSADGTFSWMTSFIDDRISDIQSTFESSWSNINEFFTDTLSSMESFFDDTWSAVQSGLESGQQAIESTLSTSWTGIYNNISTTLDNILSSITAAFESSISFATTAMSDLNSAVVSGLSSISSEIISWGTPLSSAFGSAFENAFGAVQDWMSTIFRHVEDVLSNILEAVGGIVGDVGRIGSDIGAALTNAVSEAIDDMKWMFNRAVPRTLNIPNINISDSFSIPSVRVNIPSTLGGGSRRIGGGSFRLNERITTPSINMPQLAEGGIVESATIAMIGEGAESEAVMPLSDLERFVDTNGGSTDVRIHIEGDDALAELIRENAEIVVQQDNMDKRDRLKRL